MSNEVKEVKGFLLEWLIKHGREPVSRSLAWGMEHKWWVIFEKCNDYGYIDSLQDPFTRKFNHKITDAGLEYLNERHTTK